MHLQKYYCIFLIKINYTCVLTDWIINCNGFALSKKINIIYNKGLICMKKIVVIIAGLVLLNLPVCAKEKDNFVPANYPEKYTREYVDEISEHYKVIGKEEVFYVALDMLKNTSGNFSRLAILGNNLTEKPVKVEFKNLGEINKAYESFDALGWKKGKRLYIFINPRHKDAPPGALAALLAHEALHQDEYNSLAEETYAWTMEAAVWCEILKEFPESQDNLHPLVVREDTLKKLFEKGNYTSKYIKKTVHQNKGYENLPATSPGFESL